LSLSHLNSSLERLQHRPSSAKRARDAAHAIENLRIEIARSALRESTWLHGLVLHQECLFVHQHSQMLSGNYSSRAQRNALRLVTGLTQSTPFAPDATESSIAALREGGEHMFVATHFFGTDPIWSSAAAEALTPGDPALLKSAAQLASANALLGQSWIEPDSRVISTDDPPMGGRAAALPRTSGAYAIEPLLQCAQQLLDSEALIPEAEAELRSLSRSLHAEWINPAQDLLTLERLTFRTARFLVQQSAERRDLPELTDLLHEHPLGVADEHLDRANAHALIEGTLEYLGQTEAFRRATSSVSSDQLDALSKKTERLGEPNGWLMSKASAIGWGFAIYALDELGIFGIALRSLVWLIVSLYGIT
jgi:hypothetical protein